MAWPVAVGHVKIGSVLRRNWTTPTGRDKAEARLVIDVGPHCRNYIIQMNEDCCEYVVTAGLRVGQVGRCTRLSMSTWANAEWSKHAEWVRHEKMVQKLLRPYPLPCRAARNLRREMVSTCRTRSREML